MKNLIIVRGISGSGKTTFASLLGRAICSADDYVTRNGKYVWRPETISKSHAWCQRKCELFMKRDVSPVIICNTSVNAKDLVPYTNMAEKYGYKVFSIIVENRHGGVNVHNVPEETLQRQEKNFDVKLR